MTKRRQGSATQVIYPDPRPDLPIGRGPENKGVGSWVPNEKHRLLAYYLDASRHAWSRWPNRVFIDPFCGPGRIQVKGETQTRDGGAVVAWRALSSTAPFTKMLVGDLDKGSAMACEHRLKALGAPARAFTGPADQTVHSMIEAVPRSALCMAYVDPYNLEYLSLSILRSLSSLRVDLAINFSIMDLQRNADTELDPSRARFDDAAPGWRDVASKERWAKQNLKNEFFRYWMKLVTDLGFEASQEMPLVKNDDGNPLYRLVFFAKNTFPNGIWASVARSPNLDLFD